MHRLHRHAPYLPRCGDHKHRLAIASAWRGWFGEDPSEEILDRFLKEVGHRTLRSNSSKGPQPYRDADLKVWGRIAAERGHRELLDHLIGVARAHQLARVVRALRRASRQ